MNFMVTKLSPRQLIFLFGYLFVLYFQTADLYNNEAALFARPMLMEYLYFAYYWRNNMSLFKQEAFTRVSEHNVACFLLVS